jgi:hypothetical protein
MFCIPSLLTDAKRREWLGCWGLLGWLLITSDYGSFPHSLLSTSKIIIFHMFLSESLLFTSIMLIGTSNLVDAGYWSHVSTFKGSPFKCLHIGHYELRLSCPNWLPGGPTLRGCSSDLTTRHWDLEHFLVDTLWLSLVIEHSHGKWPIYRWFTELKNGGSFHGYVK